MGDKTGRLNLEYLCYTCDMPPIIRASEIGAYLYCRRAWWYRKQGLEAENQAELATGSALHRQHGRQVLAAGLLSLAIGLPENQKGQEE